MQFNLSDEDTSIVQQAIAILQDNLVARDNVFSSPQDTRNYLQLKMANLQYEVFGVLFLDNRHRLIQDKTMFRGTVDGASVYPREVAKETLQQNAAAVVFYHNHPSGVAEPSAADRSLTQRLTDALALFDIRVLDHLLVAGCDTTSFAERGLL